MVRVRKVPGLERLALAAYRQLVVDLSGKVEEAVRGKQMGLGMEQEVMRRVMVFVTEVQDFVWPTVVCYLTQQVAQETLDGVIEALERKKKTWTMETNMAEFRLQVTAMMKMTDLMHLPGLRFLDLEQVPKMMRPGVLRSLKNFRDLWRINMGFSAGGRRSARGWQRCTCSPTSACSMPAPTTYYLSSLLLLPTSMSSISSIPASSLTPALIHS